MNLNKFLAGTAAAIFVTIIIVSAIFLTSEKIKTAKEGVNTANIQISNQTQFKAPVPSKDYTYTKLGQLRIRTKQDKNKTTAILIVTTVLKYKANDKSFYEELDGKTKMLQEQIKNYFSNHTTAELFKKGEDRVKRELLQLINDQLVLQKIQEIYFDDYQFL